MSSLPDSRSQCLLIDADDTLWENNIYFERVIARFVTYLDHAEYSPEQVRGILHQVGLQYIDSHGYGTHSFARALVATFEQLSAGPLTPELRSTVYGLAEVILDEPVEVIPGVSDTLDYLAGRHRLILMTKGDLAEQMGKVEQSGLKRYFSIIEIVPKKDTFAYTSVAARHGLQPEASWMVGNSPRSDINPALAAGLNAVFVPHWQTSMFEREELVPGSGSGKLLHLQAFGELKNHF